MKKYERNEFGDVIDYRFEFIKGDKRLYGNYIDRTEFAVTVILKSEDRCSYINGLTESEAWDTINNHVENYDKIIASDKRRSDYLMSDEGAWGRQDSF